MLANTTDELVGDFDGGWFLAATVARRCGESGRFRACELALDYVFNDSTVDDVSTCELAHVVSLRGRVEGGHLGLRAELTGGLGDRSQPDLIGFVAMPFVHLWEPVQLVFRYTLVHAFDDDGVRFARYESRIEPGRGDRYDEVHTGLNWLVYGHRLKLQTGFQYAWMRDRAGDGGDHRGWGWSTGLRVSW